MQIRTIRTTFLEVTLTDSPVIVCLLTGIKAHLHSGTFELQSRFKK